MYGLLGISTAARAGACLEVDYAQGPELLFFKIMRLYSSGDTLRLAQLLITSLGLENSHMELLDVARSLNTVSLGVSPP